MMAAKPFVANGRPSSAGTSGITGAAKLDSLRRIQRYLLAPAGSEEQSKLPEPKTLFNALQTVLENHCGGNSEDLSIANLALETIGEACAWLPQWCADEERRAGKLQGPGQARHVARGCLTSCIPAVISCFSKRKLCAGAEACLGRVAACSSEALPDVYAILCSALVHHGMEHDDKAVRLESTRCLPRLLAQGLATDPNLYHAVLEG